MNGNETKTRAAMQFMGWLKRFHPQMHAFVVERVGEAPPADLLTRSQNSFNNLGAPWDRLYPSMFYPSTGYRGRWHSDAEHLGSLGQNGWDPSFETSTTAAPSGDGEPWYKGVLDFAKEAIPAYLAYDAQKDLMELNMERARRGQPPIDPGVTAPQVRVVHQLPPEVQTSIADMKVAGVNVLLWGALGLGAFLVVRMLR